MSLPRLYGAPALYERVHAEGTDDEVWLLDKLAAEHGNGGRRALEPACGTGRYLQGLLCRAWTVRGYDLSPAMVRYARRRLARWGEKAEVERGDMRRYRTGERFDLIFNLLSTFRHLLSDRDALAHLRGSARLLNPGGLYVLGLDLARYGEDEPDEEVWTARQDGKTWRHVMMTVPPDARRRREKILNFVTRPDGRVLESHYELRSYDRRELRALLKAAGLGVAAVYGMDGRPARLDGPESSFWLVLKTSARRPAAGARPRRR